MSEHDGVVDVRTFAKEREVQQSWDLFAERLGNDESSLSRFRDFMNNYVGHADPTIRRVEGLPPQTAYRGDEPIAYTTEICSFIDIRGTVLHVREIDEWQRWQGHQDTSYEAEAIFKRGKNYLVISGNIFHTGGPSVYPVAQHSRTVTGNSRVHRLQALSPGEFNQPRLPIYRHETGAQMLVISEGPSGVKASFGGDTTYRPLDTNFIDQVTGHIGRTQTTTYALSS